VFVDLGDTDKMTEERERETGAGVHGGQLRAEGARTSALAVALWMCCAATRGDRSSVRELNRRAILT
jgi:hypothetical protein